MRLVLSAGCWRKTACVDFLDSSNAIGWLILRFVRASFLKGNWLMGSLRLFLILGFIANLAVSIAMAGDPQGRLSLTQAGFVSPDYKLTDKKDFQFVGAGLDTLSGYRNDHDIDDSLQAQIYGLVSPGVSVLSYLNVSQIYWKQHMLIVGRKKLSWSMLDDDFTLGMFQPVFKWNALQTEQQGLTGFFLNLESEESSLFPWGITLFGSTLFVPDQGPGYEIKDGQFNRSNPYFQSPPKKALINGQLDQVRYTVQKPDTQDIIFNRSFASRLYLGEDDRGFYFQGSYASKPSNQLALGFQGAVVPDNAIDVTILPAIYYHTLYSADAKYSFHYTSGYIAAGMSALQEKVQAPSYTSEWTYVSYTDSTLLSPFVEMTYSGFKARYSHLSVDGADSTATGALASQSSSVLPARLPFRGASQMKLDWLMPIKKHRALHLSTRYLTGDQSEFELLSFRGAYQWEERWSAYFASQLINVQNTPEGRATAFFPYVNNDGLGVGVQYVF